MRVSLQTRWVFFMLTTVIVVVTLMSVIQVYQLRESADDLKRLSVVTMEEDLVHQLRQRATSVTDFVAENMANPLLRFDMVAMYELTRPISQQHDILFLYIYDESGSVIHDTTRTIDRYGMNLNDEFPQFFKPATQASTFVSPGMLTVNRPIFAAEQIIGGVLLGVSMDFVAAETGAIEAGMDQVMTHKLRQSFVLVAATAVLLLLVAIALTIMVARRLVGPIKQLASYAAAVGDGEYLQNLAITRKDEIGELADAFRNMGKQLARTSREVNFLAYHDSLTSLPNRVLLVQVLERAIKRTQRDDMRKGALLFIDLDDFKRVNDTLGHAAGDKLLHEIAARLHDCLRSCDFVHESDAPDTTDRVARLGGDEFTVVLEDVDDATVVSQVAERILSTIALPFAVSGEEVVVGASIGITVFPDDGDDVGALLQHADAAMYHAKAQGKNHYQYYAETMNQAAPSRLTIESELRQALRHGEMRLFYQPIVSVPTGRLLGAEALIRWEHPDRNTLLPSAFMSVAQATGMISDLGRKVLAGAWRDASEWVSDNGDFFVAVNLSAQEFRRQNIPANLRSLFAVAAAPGLKLRLEISETNLPSDNDRALDTLQALRRAGAEVWIDDFGTGYSSLRHLRTLPVTGIKIDETFIHGIGESKNDEIIVDSLISMARGLGLQVAAEGVESAAQLEFLRARGCHLAQGFFIARPMTRDDFADFVKANPRREAAG